MTDREEQLEETLMEVLELFEPSSPSSFIGEDSEGELIQVDVSEEQEDIILRAWEILSGEELEEEDD